MRKSYIILCILLVLVFLSFELEVEGVEKKVRNKQKDAFKRIITALDKKKLNLLIAGLNKMI